MYYFRKFLLLLSTILMLGIIYISTALIAQGHVAKVYKADYATLHSGEYGMLNSDVWTAKIIQAIEKKIETFNLNANNKEDVRAYIQSIIDTLLSETERVIREQNSAKHGFFESIVGSTKQMITDTIIDFKDLRKRVPEFTDTVMIEIEKPENQVRAKKLIRETKHLKFNFL